jgi:hypothetical protein
MKRIIGAAVLVLSISSATAFAQEAIAPTETLRMTQAEVALIPEAALTRVQADLAGRIGTWTGVRSCADAARARQAFMATFNSWIGEQVTGNPGRRLVRVGTGNAPWWYENRTRSNRRSCKGGFHAAPVYADLYGL